MVIAIRRLLAPGLVGLIGAASFVAHLTVAPNRWSATGPLLVLDHLFNLLAVVTLLVICAAVGWKVLSRIGLQFQEGGEALTFAIAVGCGMVGTVLLGIGALGLLKPLWIGAALIACFAAGASSLAQLVITARHWLQRPPRPEPGSNISPFHKIITAAAAAFLLVRALSPPTDFDSLTYHLRIPLQWLQHGGIYLPEDGLHFSVVGLDHLLYVPLLALGSLEGPAILNAGFALLLGFAILSAARRFFSETTARVSLAILWASTTLLLTATTPKVGAALSYLLFMGHYALLRCYKEGDHRGLWALSGALFGLAAGVKYLSLPYVVALVPVLLWFAAAHTSNPQDSWRRLLTFAAAGMVAAAPWALKNIAYVEAPLYPFFAEPRLAPWLAEIYGSSRLPAGVNPAIYRLVSSARDPLNVKDLFFDPTRLSPEAEASGYFTNPIMAAVPLAFLVGTSPALLALLIPGLLYPVILFVFSSQLNLRYLIPFAIPLSIVAARALDAATIHARLRRQILILICAITLLPTATAALEKLVEDRSVSLVLGLVSRTGYLRSSGNWETRNYLAMTSMVNGAVGPEARILMFFEERGLLFRPQVTRDDAFTNWPLLAPASSRLHCLRDAGYTHVLIGTGLLSYFVRRGLDSSIAGVPGLRRFAEQCLAPIITTDQFTLYKVRQAS